VKIASQIRTDVDVVDGANAVRSRHDLTIGAVTSSAALTRTTSRALCEVMSCGIFHTGSRKIPGLLRQIRLWEPWFVDQSSGALRVRPLQHLPPFLHETTSEAARGSNPPVGRSAN
jgi:hypothetical protein